MILPLMGIATLILRLIFKKSVMFTISVYFVALMMVVSVDMSIVGRLGSIHNVWAVPLNFTLGILLFRDINRKLTVPLNEAIHNVDEISKGNLAVETRPTESKSELGILVNSVHHLTGSLKDIIGEVKSNADHLFVNSQQLSALSEELSKGASEQASNIEEITSTFEEIASITAENTSKAAETGEVSAEVGKTINEMVDGINSTLNTYDQIGEKIEGVNNISFQTNILALNAAVEAARAGEHGLGFAVVADEVRKLAESSKGLANEVGQLSQESSRAARDTKQIIELLLPKVDVSYKNIGWLIRSNHEQSTSIEQVNNAVQQLNLVTQQNASASEEMAASAEELSAQAESLSKLVAFFSLKRS